MVENFAAQADSNEFAPRCRQAALTKPELAFDAEHLRLDRVMYPFDVLRHRMPQAEAGRRPNRCRSGGARHESESEVFLAR